MDDLAGLDWSKTSSNTTTPAKPSPYPTGNYNNASLAAASYSQFRSTPSNISPQITNRSASPAPGKSPANNANDSFSSLLSVAGRKGTNSPGGANLGSMSLLEQQKRLMEEKREKEEAQKRQYDMQFGGLDSLGMGGGSGGASRSFANSPAVKAVNDDDADLFAAFNADAKVDRTSHFPPPSSGASSRKGTPAPPPAGGNLGVERGMSNLALGGSNNNSRSQLDNLDPFEIGNLPSRTPSPPRNRTNINNNVVDDDDDDILGELGKPASAVPPQKPPRPSRSSSSHDTPTSPSGGSGGNPFSEDARKEKAGKDPRDPVIAQLVDMGFSVVDAKRALAETDTGLDFQGAINFLLNEAHAKTKSRRPKEPERRSSDLHHEDGERRRQHRERNGEGSKPAWQGGSGGDDKDIAKYASEIGGNLLKSAGSLWNVGRKKVAQAINELQDGDHHANDGTPKWMRDAERSQASGGSGSRGHKESSNMSSEAMMLESGGRPEKSRSSQSRHHDDRRRQQELEERHRRQMQMEREAEMKARSRTSKLTREDIESETAQNYVSPARRRGNKPAASPSPAPTPAIKVEEEDLLFGGSSSSASKPKPASPTQQRRPHPQHASSSSNNPFSNVSQAPPIQRPVPTRAIPPVSSSDLQRSHASRTAGTESFKRGDYPTALTHYSSALSPLPPSHPLAFVVLANRAIVNLKLGDARAALADCETVITGIGPSKGDREPVDLGDGNSKDLKEFWGKAILRRAESLENLERWGDAAKAWSVALENGVGGGNASAGKARCEKALAPKPPPVARPQTTPARKPPVNRPVRPASAATTGTQSAEAVNRLRAANAKAEKADDEKLALYDSVEAKIAGWKGGKETNLRALLASLDSVLWEGANWKKIGMHELVIPSKVKISYMKGIAKVHPDKIPTNATTEQRMISAAVFSALNDAWDEFKKQNNL